jgi:hypothetical protein
LPSLSDTTWLRRTPLMIGAEQALFSSAALLS